MRYAPGEPGFLLRGPGNFSTERSRQRFRSFPGKHLMTSVLLYRINPEKNEARLYLVMTGPTLFYPFAVTRIWGRIDGAQRGRVTPCESPEAAEKVAVR